LPLSSNRPASSAASIYSFFLHVLPNSTAPSNARTAPTPRSSTKSRPALEMKTLNRELRLWEKIYNTVRPHQALGYLTPLQFLRLNSSQRKE
jgi:transposase InsO family protein